MRIDPCPENGNQSCLIQACIYMEVIMRLKRFFLIGLTPFILAGLMIGCSSSDSDDEESTSTSSNVSSTAVTIMREISSNYIPDSMASSSSSSSSRYENLSIEMADDSGDPCEGTDLFGCQSRLLKMYISMSKDIFDNATSFISEVGSHLGSIPDGDSGVVTAEDGTVIHYDKVSATDWDFLAVTSLGTFFDLSINGNVYALKMDSSNSNDAEDDEIVQLSLVISYTDESNWSLTSIIAGFECNAEDVRAPERIKMIISRSGDIYTGKAMLYSPRWAYFDPDPTCSSTVDDNHSMSLYTDYVANDAAGKVKVYMMKRNVADISSIVNYPMSSLCDIFYENFGASDAAQCLAWLSGGDMSPVQYPNPFCTTGPDQATWESDCTGVDATVQATDYGPSTDWTAPATLYTEEITLRSSL